MPITPGEWQVDTDYIIAEEQDIDLGEYIAQVGDGKNWRANARAIAALPKMLKALREISEYGMSFVDRELARAALREAGVEV